MLLNLLSKMTATRSSQRFNLYYIFTCGMIILTMSCNKEQVKGKNEKLFQNRPATALLSQLKGRLESSSQGRDYLNNIEKKQGNILWGSAKFIQNEYGAAHLIPVTTPDESHVQSVLVIEGIDTVRLKLLTNNDADPAGQSELSKAKRLIGYFNFELEKQRAMRESAIKFRILPNPGIGSGTAVDRKAAYVLSVCYEYTVCTGDGNGNCIGNYTFYTECHSSVYWIEDYDYIQYGGGYSDPNYGSRPGRGGSGGSGSANATYLLPPTSPVTDLNFYTGCFDRSQPGKLTIYVDQPQPGSDEPFTILGKMGHVFISLEQKVGGTTIRRFFGFHPSGKVSPFGNRISPGVIGNDQSRKHDIYLPIELNAIQFDAALGAIFNHTPNYDLENYNCTDFALDVAAAAGHTLPRNSGWWIFGSGRNPGRLGEDLRSSPGHVSRTGYAPSNIGSCFQ